MDIQFTKGKFITLRAVKKIHLGAVEVDVYEGDELEYDGQTLKLGGKEHNVPNLRAGIRAGWFVADGAFTEAPKAAGAPTVAPTLAPTLSDKLRRPVQTIEDDERPVGFATRDARERAAGLPKAAVASSDEGVSVGKVRIAAHQRTVLTDSSSVSQEISRLDNMTARVTRGPVATGDVQEAAAGDDLEDILPNVPSTGKPTPGRAGDGHDGMTPEERAELARRVRLASVATAPEAPPAAASEVARLAAAAGEAEDDVAGLFGDLLNEPDADADADGIAAAKARMSLAKMAVPGFEWDLTSPWRTRVKLGLAKRDDPVYLNAILAVETDTVKKHIGEGLKA